MIIVIRDLIHQQKQLLASVDFVDFVDFTWILQYAIDQLLDSVDSALRNQSDWGFRGFCTVQLMEPRILSFPPSTL